MARPCKKKKESEYFLELKWFDFDMENDKEIEFSMFADEIPSKAKGGFLKTPAILENFEGENHERNIHMYLVDGKSAHRNVLVNIETFYWIVPINLMHFNILSLELADFCRDLWIAAGRKESLYCDMAIEFGESKYSGVEIRSLIKSATAGRIKGKKHILYFKEIATSPEPKDEDSKKLLQMLLYSTSIQRLLLRMKLTLQS